MESKPSLNSTSRTFRLIARPPLALIAVLCLFASAQVLAEVDGRSGRAGTTAATCAGGCHTAGAAVPTVVLTGKAAVAPGETNTYTLTITAGTGAPAVSAALDVAASAGTLAVVDTTTKLSDATTAGRVVGEIVQIAPKPMTAGVATYTFSWTAPATAGPVTLYAAGLTANGDGAENTGDATAQTTLAVTVGAAAPAPTPTNPVARITGPTTGAAGVALNFSGTTSTDDGTIVSYAWEMGDGVTYATATTPHTYTAAGTYTVRLTVTDNTGATGTVTQSVVITAAGTASPPTANPNGPYTGTVGTAITFSSAGSVDADGTIAGYAWDFGDGTTSTLQNPTKTYNTAGNFTVRLTVTDNTAMTGTRTTTATVAAAGTVPVPVPPVAPPTTPPADGLVAYGSWCEECHGPVAGPAGPDGSVAGASATESFEAIIAVPEMQTPALQALTVAQLTAIGEVLVAAASDGDDDDAAAAPAPPTAPATASAGTRSGTVSSAVSESSGTTLKSGGGALAAFTLLCLAGFAARRRGGSKSADITPRE